MEAEYLILALQISPNLSLLQLFALLLFLLVVMNSAYRAFITSAISVAISSTVKEEVFRANLSASDGL